MKRRLVFYALAACCLLGCSKRKNRSVAMPGADTINSHYVATSGPYMWIFKPGYRVGEIKAGSSEQDIIDAYGRENVLRTIFDQGEGNFVTGTKVFPGTPEELLISWKDTLNFREPERVVIAGSNSRWMTYDSLTIGTGVEKLEALNGRPFTIRGFGWDYGGVIASWNGGRLEQNQFTPDNIVLQLVPDENKNGVLPKDMTGEQRLIASNDPGLRKLKPKVGKISLYFGREL